MRLESRHEYCVRMIPAGASSILDIGCGEGRVLSELPAVAERVGVDTDEDLIEAARRADPRARYLAISGGRLPFDDGHFDAVILSEVLEHVGEENKTGVVDEAVRVLRRERPLVLTSPHRGPLSRLDPLDYV